MGEVNTIIEGVNGIVRFFDNSKTFYDSMKEAVNLLDEIGKLPSGLSFLGKCVELTNTFGAII